MSVKAEGIRFLLRESNPRLGGNRAAELVVQFDGLELWALYFLEDNK